MTQQQKSILWIGIIIVVVFLFTDQSFRNLVFKRGTANASAKTTSYTLAQILTVPASTSSGTITVPSPTSSGTTGLKMV